MRLFAPSNKEVLQQISVASSNESQRKKNHVNTSSSQLYNATTSDQLVSPLDLHMQYQSTIIMFLLIRLFTGRIFPMVDKPTFPGTLAPLFQGKRMVQTLQTQGQSYMVAPQATIFFPFFFF